jgi:hypothetical protein
MNRAGAARDAKNPSLLGSYQNIRQETGVSYTVRNVGGVEIPDYRIGIFHPKRGTLFAFPTEQHGPLLPDQRRTHECMLLKNGKSNDFLGNWILREGDTPVEEVEIRDFTLRLIMKDSDRVLFESSTMGNAMARHWLKVVRTGEWGATWEEHKAMCTTPPSGLRF